VKQIVALLCLFSFSVLARDVPYFTANDVVASRFCLRSNVLYHVEYNHNPTVGCFPYPALITVSVKGLTTARFEGRYTRRDNSQRMVERAIAIRDFTRPRRNR